VDAIREIERKFQGKYERFQKVMMELAQNMHFEEAQKIKEKIEVLENYQSRSTIVNPKSPISMFSIVSDESAAYVNFYKFHMVLLSAHILWK
jgi:excinuclease ABC subunit C